MSTTLTSKGQVTIPKLIREYLGLKPGSPVDFEYASDGRVVLTPAQPARTSKAKKSRFAQLRGTGKRVGISTDDLMNLLRGYDEDKDDPGFK